MRCFTFYLSGAESKPCIQYFCYKIDKFQHFYYFYKQVKEFLRRIRNKESENNDLIDVVFKHDFVKCGVIGEFTDEDLLLLSKGIVAYYKDMKIKSIYGTKVKKHYFF